jgi:ubiquinone/menaquinone biosynthesis C-methylase UbiE
MSSAAFAGSVPANYEQYLGPILFEPYALDLAARLKGDKINKLLEIACGTGRVTRHLLPLLSPGGELIATDLNPDMLDVAKQKIKSDQPQWQVADAQELSFSDAEFDHIVCQFGVMFFPDKEKAFREAFRVLQPGGMYLFNTWDSVEHNPRVSIVRKVMTELTGEESAAFFTKGPFAFFDAGEIEGMLAKAGFKNITIEWVEKTSQLENPDGFITGFVDGSPLAMFVRDKPEEVKKQMRQRLTEELLAQAAQYKDKVPMRALVCRAEK